MLLRLELEEREHRELTKYATKSDESKGRRLPEEKCQLRTEFQRDRDRIIHSKALRRLMHKTQVFLSPEGDHFRTRLTHTLEVSQISRIIARSLGLNEDLTEAIAMGHDLGHTPFGHNGEDSLNKIHKDGFKHNEQSLRVVDLLENSSHGPGLNLTFEVRDGILNHSGKNIPMTLEGQIVRISDRIAYINHDIEVTVRASGATKAILASPN
jgi:dGTPase